MMDQRTLNIINICKGNTKYNKPGRVYDAIRNYMADECAYKPEWYTDKEISLFLWEALKDYIDHCDKPSFVLWCLKDVMDKHNWDMYHAIAVVFSAYTQVKDNNGNYVNGFDDRIHALDKEGYK